MTHSFQRYTAAGNTFVVMNTWEDPLSLSREEMRVLVRMVCDRQGGSPRRGSDGVILVNQPSKSPSPNLSPRGGEETNVAAFRMDFYNPDGSTGMLCGNGARCAVEAARDYGFVSGDSSEFEVLGAINRAEILENGSIRVYFQDPKPAAAGSDGVIRREELALEGHSIVASYLDVGSQHAVIDFSSLQNEFGEKDIETMDIARFGPLVRWHSQFTPLGANANFVEVREDGDEKYLRIRTYERGVEGETLACGTGCMSAAIDCGLRGLVKTPVRLLTQSGEFVCVDFEIDGKHITNLSLEGPVVKGEEGILKFDENTGSIEVQYV